MEYFYQIFQQPVGMERGIFVKVYLPCVASINVAFLECAETGVWSIVLLQFLISLVNGLIIFDEPEICILTFVKHGFEG